MAEVLSLATAFLGGFLAFFAPCILPILPAYLSYLAGGKKDRLATFANAVFFVAGFSVFFIIFGIAAAAIGMAAESFQQNLAKIGGILVVLFGLHTLGLLKLATGEKKLFRPKSGSYAASFAIGASFALGWTPCVGPILAGILILASTSGSLLQGGLLLTAFSIGLSIPLLVVGYFTAEASEFIQRHQTAFRYINIISGLLLIALGILLFEGRLAQLVALVV